MSYNLCDDVNDEDGVPMRTSVREPRHDGWTEERQFAFLEELAQHGNVVRAAAEVGLSASSAYRLRHREAAGTFGVGWRAAAEMAYQRLRDLALNRIEYGVTTPVYGRGGEYVGPRINYSDRLLLGMLNHLRPDGDAAPRGRAAPSAAGRVDPVALYAAVVDAYSTALETGEPPVVPPVVPPVGPGTTAAASPPADPAPAVPSPGEGPYHDARVGAALARLRRGVDPYAPRFAERIYAPRPDALWLECYPDGMTADDLAGENQAELAFVGLAPDGTELAEVTAEMAAAITAAAAGMTRAAWSSGADEPWSPA